MQLSGSYKLQESLARPQLDVELLSFLLSRRGGGVGETVAHEGHAPLHRKYLWLRLADPLEEAQALLEHLGVSPLTVLELLVGRGRVVVYRDLVCTRRCEMWVRDCTS